MEDSSKERLEALRRRAGTGRAGTRQAGAGQGGARRADPAAQAAARGSPTSPSPEVNNHVHTSFSFSPYSPAEAAEKADAAGLSAVGIVDHDTTAGAWEMREAGKIIGIATTTGTEIRVSAAGTRLSGRKINNPDSPGIMYMMIHGIPARSLPLVESFLSPIRASREARSRRMTDSLNAFLPGVGLGRIDFDAEVYDRSQAAAGGTITERHILFALSRRIVTAAGKGPALPEFLKKKLGVEVPARLAALLSDADNPFLLYDLLGVLKSSFRGKVFIQPDSRECVPVSSAVKMAVEAGGIPCYGYLGDVTESPTGDKTAEKFEDDYLDLLFEEVKSLGFQAVTYMPPRNTLTQLRRVRELCAAHGLMEVSGVDINSPRQSFNCPEILMPEFSHLITATWALIAHENLSHADPRYGLFSPRNPLAGLPLKERISRYAEVGEAIDRAHPDAAVESPVVKGWG